MRSSTRHRVAAGVAAVVLALAGAGEVDGAEPPETDREQEARLLSSGSAPQESTGDRDAAVAIAIASVAALGFIAIQALLERRVRSHRGRLRLEWPDEPERRRHRIRPRNPGG